jgi:hypothetical protein
MRKKVTIYIEPGKYVNIQHWNELFIQKIIAAELDTPHSIFGELKGCTIEDLDKNVN